MSEPYVGEIRMFAGNFAPRGWAFCDGQLLAVSENDALFSLFGTIYGGDGRITFGLPDLRGCVPLHQGTGPGLSPRRLGSKGGEETVTVTVSQLAAHDHGFRASTAVAAIDTPQAGFIADTGGALNYLANTAPGIDFAPVMVGHAGGSQPHTNLMPTLCVNFIVALFGVYPSQT